MSHKLSLLTAVAIGLISAMAAEARAQPSDPQRSASAQALYDEAVTEMDRKDYGTACPKLEEVVRLTPGSFGGKFTLAECYEESGRLASAWSAYAVAAEAATQPVQAKKAQQRGAALKPKLAQLTIVVPEEVRGLSGLKIQRNGTVVKLDQWGAPLHVDKGSHVIVATATGKLQWEKTIEVSADGVSVATSIEGLVAAPPTVPTAVKVDPAPPPRKANPNLPPESPKPATDTAFSNQRIAGLLVGGLGLVGVGVGTAFGVIAFDKYDESNDGHCDGGNQCDQAGVDLRDEGLTAGTVSTVMFVVGGIALAGGVTLFVTAPTATDSVSAKVSVGPGGVQIRGAW